MPRERSILISGREYRRSKEVDRYQIHLNELDDFRMCDIPAHSHVEILGLPDPIGKCTSEVYGLNAGGDGELSHLSVYGGVSYEDADDEQHRRNVARLRRAFPDALEPVVRGEPYHPEISSCRTERGFVASVYLGADFESKPETRLREAVQPFVDGYRRLSRPGVRVFICHASEDKTVARQLAQAMTRLGADVWFDEWVIKVGDSIVEKINDALGTVSHLIVLLSKTSVTRPWVKKELSSALIQGLSQAPITVLPLRLDDAPIPPIPADLKYADGRRGINHAVIEIEQAIFDDREVRPAAPMKPTEAVLDAAPPLDFSHDPERVWVRFQCEDGHTSWQQLWELMAFNEWLSDRRDIEIGLRIWTVCPIHGHGIDGTIIQIKVRDP